MEKEVDMTEKVFNLLDGLREVLEPEATFEDFEARFRKEGGNFLIPDGLELEEAWSHCLVSLPRYLIDLIIGLKKVEVKELVMEEDPGDLIVV